MNITYSEHAEKRIKQRGLTKLEIEYVLSNPIYLKKSMDGKKETIGEIRGRGVKIVFIERENYINIITVI